MNAEILSVGTEILLGNIVNTDARDLALALCGLGINVYWQTVVGDNPGRVKEAVALARKRADILITTGGLGPTCDDLTKQTVAEAFGKKLYYDKRAEAELLERFAGRRVTENNFLQCWLPEGCEPFYNTCGTAPGCGFVTEDGKAVVILPGPPKELNAMLRHGALDFLRRFSGGGIWSKNLHVFGMGESAVESLLREDMLRLENPTLAPYAKEGEVRLRITARAENEAEAEALMEPVVALCREKLGDLIYAVETPETLEGAVLELLTARGVTFAAAEGCSGGLLAERFTRLPGAWKSFRGGVSFPAGGGVLGMEAVPVTEEAAGELARRVRETVGADCGLALLGRTGEDEPGDVPVGRLLVALADEDGTEVLRLDMGSRSDRIRDRYYAVNRALDALRRRLLGLTPMESLR
ncbi:MAG: CinA family nicotinamide mononucleotide deamidase-related protein [Oscillospiraceae bacterium]|nr:CinA family nicotinamide mononucleotide deamidase-related protein [Oscillospiraceae bacterium]